MRTRPLAAVIALSSLLSPLAARAQGAGDKAAAEALFQQGKALLDAKRYSEACPKLAASLKAEPAIGTLLNLARCHELEGKTASAWAEYKEVVTLARNAGQNERVAGATELAAKLEPGLSKLKIEAAGAAPGLVVTRDASPVAEGALGAFIPVDPGEHVVTAEAPGYAKWTSKIAVGKNAAQVSVTIPALQKLDGAPGAEAPQGPSGARVAGFVLGGVGVAGLGVGAAFGILTLSAASNARKDPALCPNEVCSKKGREEIDAAGTKATVSTIALVASGAALATGVVLVVITSLKKGKSAPATGHVLVHPWAGPEAGGVGAIGVF